MGCSVKTASLRSIHSYNA